MLSSTGAGKVKPELRASPACPNLGVGFTYDLDSQGSQMDVDKIAAAVQSSIADALKSEKPFRSVNDSLALLKRHGWSKADRLEIQTQVLQELKRRRTQQPPPP